MRDVLEILETPWELAHGVALEVQIRHLQPAKRRGERLGVEEVVVQTQLLQQLQLSEGFWQLGELVVAQPQPAGTQNKSFQALFIYMTAGDDRKPTPKQKSIH